MKPMCLCTESEIKYLHCKFSNKNFVLTKNPQTNNLKLNSIFMQQCVDDDDDRKERHVQTCMCLQNVLCLNFIKAFEAFLCVFNTHSA